MTIEPPASAYDMTKDVEPEMAATFAVLVDNEPGVLHRVVGLFSARGYNIESLSVGETLDPSVSRMTLVVTGDEFVIEQVMKQLHKLIDVIKVNDLTDDSHVERELVLIRVNAEPQHRAEILRTADIFRARVIDVTPVSFVLEATGDEGKVEALIELLRPIGVQEVVRTGKIAITRGPKTRVKRAPSSRPRVSEDPRVVGFAD